jgi:hypothetical protein
MTKIFITIFSLAFVTIYSQVGIDTTEPKATLDVTAKPADLSKIDGIIAPRLSGNELKSKDGLYGPNQNAAFVYATSAASPTTAKTVDVTKSGYYYYDSLLAKWVAFQSSAESGITTNEISNPINTITSIVNGISTTTNAVNVVSNTSAANSNTLTTTVNGVTGTSVNLVKSVSNTVSATNFLTTTVNGVASTPVAVKNIYNSDGTLTGDRTMTMAGYRLYLEGITGTTRFSNDTGGASIAHLASTGRADFIMRAGTSALQVFVDPNAAAQISAGTSSTSLSLGTSGTNAAAPIGFFTSTGGGANRQYRAEIAGDGRFNIVNNLSVGYGTQQTFTGTQKLKVNGSIVTTSNTYPDYVFEKYFTGNSIIKPDYHFKKLEETKSFVKENHHLPGIVSIKDLQKSEDGYDVDMTQLSIQQLEKIEELYLHAFDQEETIKQQQTEIIDLKLRLEKLERITLK